MSNSQHGQEHFVLEHLNQKRDGYFLDIGAYDGVEFSNTYSLEKDYGWKGLLVECDPQALDKLKANRSSAIDKRAVWSKSGAEVEFKSVEGGKLSGITKNLEHPKSKAREGKLYFVSTVSLNDLLNQHNCPAHIDYMSMDIEGSEYDVLSAYDFSRTFGIISLEHWKHEKELEELMLKNGYKIAKKYELEKETIFVRDDDVE